MSSAFLNHLILLILGLIPMSVCAQSNSSPAQAMILSHFSVSRTAENHVRIDWATSTEENIRELHIERSVDGRNFQPIQVVAPRGARNRFTTYSLIDDKPIFGKNYYRLRETDIDGNMFFHAVKMVSLNLQTMPFRVVADARGVCIQSGGATGRYQIELYDNGGFRHQLRTINILSSTSEEIIPLPGRSGTYHVIISGEGSRESRSIFIGK